MNRITQAFFRTNFGAGKTGLKVGHKECLASSSLKPSNMPFWRGRLGGSVTSSSVTYASGRHAIYLWLDFCWLVVWDIFSPSCFLCWSQFVNKVFVKCPQWFIIINNLPPPVHPRPHPWHMPPLLWSITYCYILLVCPLLPPKVISPCHMKTIGHPKSHDSSNLKHWLSY